MDIEEQEGETGSRRRSTRIRGSPSATSPVRSNARKRGRGGRGRGRGRSAKTRRSASSDEEDEVENNSDSEEEQIPPNLKTNGTEFDQEIQQEEIDGQDESSSSEESVPRAPIDPGPRRGPGGMDYESFACRRVDDDDDDEVEDQNENSEDNQLQYQEDRMEEEADDSNSASASASAESEAKASPASDSDAALAPQSGDGETMEVDNSSSASFAEDSSPAVGIPETQAEEEPETTAQIEPTPQNVTVKAEANSSSDGPEGQSHGQIRRSSADSRLSDEPTPKKACLEINIRKLLPDLEKHWKTVEEDPNDFTAWTYLLQYVDQENELLAAREAYDAFLCRYPYCYGYWKKYADYEKRRGSSSDCEQVFQRGLKAVSLSVDLWIHYLNYVKATHEKEPDYIRAQFEAAVASCGMEFRSDKLWEHYVHWERENANLKNVLAIYDRVISMPTQSHAAHFQHVKDLINQSMPEEILSDEEMHLVLEQDKEAGKPDSDISEEARLRKIILDKRSELYKKNEAEILARWSFEEAIKRPYFHVKPLEKGQLKIWKEYLDFEIEKGNFKRIIVLFERCLIACALYEEYWIKYTRFLQTQPEVDAEKLRDVFVRGSAIHLQKKPWINLHWASFEEGQGNKTAVVSILDNLEKQFPDSLHIQYRRINFERRTGNLYECDQLFQKYILSAKNKSFAAHLSMKYARFLSEEMNDYNGAKKTLQDAVELDEGSRLRAIMGLVDLGVNRKPIDVELVLSAFDSGSQQGLSNEQKLALVHRKVEFLEDYSPDSVRIEKAQVEMQIIAKLAREQKPSEEAGRAGEDPSKGNNGNAYPEGSQSGSFGQQYNQYGQGQYSNWNSNPSGGYNNSQQQQGWSAYQGYYA